MDRQEINDYILNEFGVEGERLWIQFPDYEVFRNGKNKKWFAIMTDIEKSKLGLEGSDRISIINVKCDPILIGSLLHNDGFLPAYHMSKKTWITIILSEVSDEQIKDLLHLSYDIIDSKR